MTGFFLDGRPARTGPVARRGRFVVPRSRSVGLRLRLLTWCPYGASRAQVFQQARKPVEVGAPGKPEPRRGDRPPSAEGAAAGSLGRKGLVKNSAFALRRFAPKGLHRIAQGQLCPELVEGQSATLGTEPATNQNIACKAYINRVEVASKGVEIRERRCKPSG